MKHLHYGVLFSFCLLLLGVAGVHAQPPVVYVSPNGDDSAPGTQEQPWRTVQRVQSALQDLPPGSQILFERSGVYPGTLTLDRSGSADLPLVLGAYGEGETPIISGLTPLTSWINIGRNQWQAACASCAPHTDLLLLDGHLQRKARFPNPDEGDHGYLYFDAAVGQSQISDEALTSGTNWSGGELVIRSIAWVLDRYPITAHEGDTLSLGLSLDDTSYEFEVGYGYFLQNHPAALDQEGEWVFDAATQQITLYLTDDPNRHLVQTSSVDSVLRITGAHDIRVEDIAVYGATDTAVDIAGCSHIALNRLRIAYTAKNGLRATDCTRFEMRQSQISDHLSNGVLINECTDCILAENHIVSIGVWAGMGRGGDGQYVGVEFTGQNGLFEHNIVEDIGYNGVRVSGVTVRNNVVRRFALVKVDGGGIYTYGSGQSRIEGNIVLYGLGSTAAIPWNSPAVNGIYLDDDSFDIEVTSNVIGYVGASGIVLHNTRDIRVEDNIIFDAGEVGILMADDALGEMDSTRSLIQNNQIVTFGQSAPPLHASTQLADQTWINRLGAFSGNRYCNPLQDLPIRLSFQPDTDLSLSIDQWQADYGYDAASKDCGLRLPPYVEVGPPGSNRLVNDSLDDWGWWSEQPFSVTWAPQNGGTVRAALPATSALVYAEIGAGAEGQVFRVSMQAQARRPTPMTMYLQQSHDPWSQTTPSVQFQLSAQETVYTAYLNVQASEDQQRLTLEFQGGAADDVVIHTISIQPVEAVPQRLDDFALLEVNEDTTPRTLVIPDDITSDLSGQPMTPGTSLTLPPYSGVILLRQQP